MRAQSIPRRQGVSFARYPRYTFSISSRVLSDDALVHPAHDYHGQRVSSIGQEKARNPRIGAGKSLEEFVQIMSGLGLAYPQFIDHAVPGNRQCGVCPADVPEDLRQYCEHIALSPQG